MKRLLFVFLCILCFVSYTHEATRGKDVIYYLEKYLVSFPNLTAEEVLAVIYTESKFDPSCITYEANVDDYSYGPMQVLLSTAYGMGFKGSPDDLLTWKEGLYWGMRFLSYCKERAQISVKKDPRFYYSSRALKDLVIRKRMFAMYNAGRVAFKYVRGVKRYINHKYVYSCLRYYNSITRGG